MEGLRERHLGKLQGLPRKDAQRLEPEAYKIFVAHLGDKPIPGGGESINDLSSRAKLCLEEIAHNHLGERVLVITHGGVVRALHRHATGMSPTGRILNTSINIFRITNENVWALQCWGDTSHLSPSIRAAPMSDQDSA
ncbi:hypothetical protein KP509_23G085700 [Ceratopteris richardii]|nr:hypothetical protein KP509_23G085700 [Ceratopteris richardii]